MIVEDGTGIISATSYAALDFATAYFAAHLYADKWTAANDARREAGLQMATRMIDAGMEWDGIRATTHQALDWPRAYVPRQFALLGPTDAVSTFYAAGLAQRYWLPTVIPPLLANAVCEYALELLSRNRAATPDYQYDGVKRVGLGDKAIEVEFADAAQGGASGALFPDFVAKQLSIFGRPAGRRAMVPVRRGL